MDALPVLSTKHMNALMFQKNNRWHFFENLPDNASETFSAVIADMGDPKPDYWRFNVKNVNILAAPTGLNAITGRQGKVVFVMGSGSFENPTGTITVNPPAGGATVNGAASVALAGFSGPVVIYIYHLIATNDYRVQAIGQRSVAGIAAWTGTGSNLSRAVYTTGNPGAAYAEAWADGIDAAVVNLSQGFKNLVDHVRTLGLMT